MKKVVICEFLDQGAVDWLSPLCRLVYDSQLVHDASRLRSEISDADGLIVRSSARVTDELLSHAPNLSVLGRLGVGLDNIDLESCARRNITVCPATGANDVSVAEYTIAMIFNLLRGAYLSTNSVAAGDWPRQKLIGQEAAGKTLGIVGLGRIGRQVAKRARALDINVVATDPYVPVEDPAWNLATRIELEPLLSCSHAVSLHVPLTDETRGMIAAREVSLMAKGSVLINTARGGVVVESAIAEALRENHLAGVAIDVFEEEPFPSERGRWFDGLPNVFLTPHIAGVTIESNVRVSMVTVQNVARELGLPLP